MVNVAVKSVDMSGSGKKLCGSMRQQTCTSTDKYLTQGQC